MDFRGDPTTGAMAGDPRARGGIMPPPPPTSRTPPTEPQGSDWFLFYSPRSKPSMKFIEEAKKIEQVCSNINLINFDDNPRQMLTDNPWLKDHGLPALAMNGEILSKKPLFDWLNSHKSGPPEPKKNSGPSATHLGESSFGNFSSINDSLTGEVSTDNYSSIGAKQGSEGINHEEYSETGQASLSLDALEAQRKMQLQI